MFPSANTNLAGSAWNEGMSQDVVFVGEGNRVYDLNYYGLRYYPNPGSGANIPGPGYYPWAVFDVIKIGDQIAQVTMPLPISVAATPRGGSPLAVFTSPVSSTGLGLGGPVGNVLVYIGDNHTIEAVYLVNQSPLNLTQASGTEKHPQPTGNSLAAWSWLGQRSQHVVYVDADNNVSELYSVNSLFHWSYNNLSGHTGYTGTNSPGETVRWSGTPLKTREPSMYSILPKITPSVNWSIRMDGQGTTLATKQPRPSLPRVPRWLGTCANTIVPST